jgi:RNA polymerase sigma factor (TIGR02999 family)
MTSSGRDVTRLLVAWSNGDAAALGELVPAVYDELRGIAARQMRAERRGHTLAPTALVHEAYVRLVDQQRVQWQNRAQFFAVAAEVMRRVLVDHARARQAAKRGGGAQRVTLIDDLPEPDNNGIDVLLLDGALTRLCARYPEQGRLVELRFFGGLTIEETAEVLGSSAATVKRQWDVAKAWLVRDMDRAVT